MNGAAWAACTSPARYGSLANGNYEFQVRALNGESVDPTPSTAQWAVDTTTPAISLATPANGSATNENKPTFSGAAGTETGDSSSIEVKIYSGSSTTGSPMQTLSATASAGSWSVQAGSALSDGAYTAQAEQEDAAGNVGKSSAATFTVDTSPPHTQIESGPAQGSTTSNSAPTFTFSGSPSADVDHFECKLDSAGFAPCTSPRLFSDLAAGEHTFTVRAIDAASNTDESPASRTWRIINVRQCGELPNDQTWHSASVPLIVLTCDLSIPTGRTLTIDAGVIIKIDSGAALNVHPGGTLNVTGSPSDPVTFTSLKDDSADGDTNGDGDLTTPGPYDYAQAIHLGTRQCEGGPEGVGPTVNVDYAVFRYGSKAVSDEGVLCSGPLTYDHQGSLQVANSDIGAGVVLLGEVATMEFTDNTFRQWVRFGSSSEPLMAPRLSRNTFAATSAESAPQLFNVDVTAFTLAGPDANHFLGVPGANALRLYGARVPPQSSWSVSAPDSPTLVTLMTPLAVEGSATLGPGTTIKEGDEEYSRTALSVVPGGTLNVTGSPSDPVTFTSLKDDSADGDTNGDGDLTTPGPYDYAQAIHLGTRQCEGGPEGVGPTVNVDYAVFRYGSKAVSDEGVLCSGPLTYDHQGSLQVANSDIGAGVVLLGEVATMEFTDNTFRQWVRFGSSSEPLMAPRLSRNTFAATSAESAPQLFNVDVTAFTLAGPDANHFVGVPGANALRLYGARVPPQSSWSVSAPDSPTLVTLMTPLAVEGSATLGPGTTIKEGDEEYSRTALSVVPGGTLNVTGSPSDPVTFTSLKDDSADGDTNGDGDLTTPGPYDYAQAIHLGTRQCEGGPEGVGPTVNVDYAVFRYGSKAVSDEGVLCSGPLTYDHQGSLQVANSDIGAGVVLLGEVATMEFTDNTFRQWVRFGSSSEPLMAPRLSRNTFAATSAESAPQLFNVDVTAFTLAGPDANHFVGVPGANALRLYGARVPPQSSWSVSAPDSPTLVTLMTPLAVEGSATLGPGTTIKEGDEEYSRTALSVVPGGTLNVTGSPSDPVTFTSLKDDSADGDTNGDGDLTTPGPYDYAQAIHLGTRQCEGGPEGVGPTVNVDYAVFRYGSKAVSDEGVLCSGPLTYDHQGSLQVANSDIGAGVVLLGEVDEARFTDTTIHDAPTGLNVQGGKVAFRGAFANVAYAVRTCNWGWTDCGVDAAYSYWGSPDGPAGLVCGAVTTSPWYSSPEGTSTTTGGAFVYENCDGTASPTDRLLSAEVAANQIVSRVQSECDGGQQSACEEVQAYYDCLIAFDEHLNSSSAAGEFLGELTTLVGALESVVPPAVSIVNTVAEYATTAIGAVYAYQDCSARISA